MSAHGSSLRRNMASGGEPTCTQPILQDAAPELWGQHRFGLPAQRWTSLSDRTIWVTGAGTGYGRCIAVALALAGCKVYISGRRPEKLALCIDEVDSLAQPKHALVPIPLDLTDADAVRKAAAQVRDASPVLHGLVHCAALPQPHYQYPLLEMPVKAWERIQATNVTAAWHLTREMAPSLSQSQAARVLFLGSEAGWADTVGHGPYNVSKASLNSLTASLANEFAARYPQADAQINLLIPGEARTEMNQGSTVSPYSVVCMSLLLLSCGPGGPNGKFFHRDGRHFCYAYTPAHIGSLFS